LEKHQKKIPQEFSGGGVKRKRFALQPENFFIS